MLTASDLMHKPVLDVSTGRELGKVNGALLDPNTKKLAAFRIDQGLLHGDRFIRWQDLQGHGPDTLTVPSEEALIKRKEVDPDSSFLDRLHGQPVFTQSGERLGDVKDYRVDTEAGDVTGFDIRPIDAPRGLFGASNSADFFISASHVITIGEESLVVQDTARKEMQT